MRRQMYSVKATPDEFRHRGRSIPRPHSNRLTAFPGSSSTTSSRLSKIPPKTVILKDERDFGNKQYVASMIKDIVQLLSRLELNHVANEDTLSSPKSRKDFDLVFEVLSSKILDREFKLDNAEESKRNEQIKQMLTSLSYPFVLKDSTLKTITAPHSWKTMLGVEVEKIDNEIVKKEDIVSKQSISSDKASELIEAIKK
uniref:Kinetochore protein NDC80 n=1 Tax=Romanomermis culicivorax TaxID=13658 RepID=A0A915JXF7_ROMCU